MKGGKIGERIRRGVRGHARKRNGILQGLRARKALGGHGATGGRAGEGGAADRFKGKSSSGLAVYMEP